MVNNQSIDNSKIILFDRFPGVANNNLTIPCDGFTGADHHNVANPAYPVGTKITVYDTINKGYATFAYLQFIAGTASVNLALAVRQWCAPDTSEQATATTVNTYYKVCDDASQSLVQTALACALSAMTTTYYGWFWVGGVCPISFVPALDGTFVTSGNTNFTLLAGCGFTGLADATAASAAKIMLALAMTGAAHATSVADKPALGMSLVADS